jgi:hypothetical protein
LVTNKTCEEPRVNDWDIHHDCPSIDAPSTVFDKTTGVKFYICRLCRDDDEGLRKHVEAKKSSHKKKLVDMNHVIKHDIPIVPKDSLYEKAEKHAAAWATHFKAIGDKLGKSRKDRKKLKKSGPKGSGQDIRGRWL